MRNEPFKSIALLSVFLYLWSLAQRSHFTSRLWLISSFCLTPIYFNSLKTEAILFRTPVGAVVTCFPVAGCSGKHTSMIKIFPLPWALEAFSALLSVLEAGYLPSCLCFWGHTLYQLLHPVSVQVKLGDNQIKGGLNSGLRVTFAWQFFLLLLTNYLSPSLQFLFVVWGLLWHRNSSGPCHLVQMVENISLLQKLWNRIHLNWVNALLFLLVTENYYFFSFEQTIIENLLTISNDTNNYCLWKFCRDHRDVLLKLTSMRIWLAAVPLAWPLLPYATPCPTWPSLHSWLRVVEIPEPGHCCPAQDFTNALSLPGDSRQPGLDFFRDILQSDSPGAPSFFLTPFLSQCQTEDSPHICWLFPIFSQTFLPKNLLHD